jgi:hypothetical protein
MPQIGHEDLGPGVLRDSAVRIKDAEITEHCYRCPMCHAAEFLGAPGEEFNPVLPSVGKTFVLRRHRI